MPAINGGNPTGSNADDPGQTKLYYRANEIPSPPKAILFGFQVNFRNNCYIWLSPVRLGISESETNEEPIGLSMLAVNW